MQSRPFSWTGLLIIVLLKSVLSTNVLSDWIRKETPLAVSRIKAHINDQGALNAGIGREYPYELPDIYPFSWLRDSAISMISLFQDHDGDNLPIFLAYKNWTNKTQLKSRMAGITDSWTRFNLTTAEPDPNWANPQNDGNSLRALSFLQFLNDANATHSYPLASLSFSDVLDADTLLKWDLDVVCRDWNKTNGFEPWEELQGQHFYNLVLAEKALDLGFQKSGNVTYKSVQNQITLYLQRDDWWNEEQGHFVSTIPSPGQNPSAGANMKLSQGHFLDVQTILALVISASISPPSPASSSFAYSILSDRAQSTFHQLLTVFVKNGTYQPPIQLSNWTWNSQTCSQDGYLMHPAIGRYPEDIWDGFGYDLQGEHQSFGAGFWFISTFGFSDFLYKTATFSQKAGKIDITTTSLAFWQFIGYKGTAARIYSTEKEFTRLLHLLVAHGDSFLHRAKQSIPDVDDKECPGCISEQIHSETGLQASSADLSWSYASFILATRARNEAVVAAGVSGGPEGFPCSPSTRKSSCPVVGGYTSMSSRKWTALVNVTDPLECMHMENIHCYVRTSSSRPQCLQAEV